MKRSSFSAITLTPYSLVFFLSAPRCLISCSPPQKALAPEPSARRVRLPHLSTATLRLDAPEDMPEPRLMSSVTWNPFSRGLPGSPESRAPPVLRPSPRECRPAPRREAPGSGAARTRTFRARTRRRPRPGGAVIAGTYPRGASRARRKSRSLPGNIPPPGHPYRLSQKLLPTGLTPREPRMLPRGSVRPFLRLPRGMSREASPGASCRVPLKSGAPPAASEPPRERLLRLIARTAALWCGLQEEDG